MSKEDAAKEAPSKIKDLLRSTFVFATPSDASNIVKSLETEFQGQKVKRNLWDPNANPATGYRDILMNLEFQGFISEVQANTPEMMAAKGGEGHKLYDAQEKLKTSYPKPRPGDVQAKIDELDERQRAIYQPAYELALRNEANRAKNSSREMGDASSLTNANPPWSSPTGQPSGVAADQAQQRLSEQATVDGKSLSSNSQNESRSGESGSGAMDIASSSDTSTNSSNSSRLMRFSRENILAVANGNRIAPMMVLAEPTKLMQRSGIDRRVPIRMESVVVDKLLTGKDDLRRRMTAEEILKLPQLLESPVAIFDDPTDKNSVVLMLSMSLEGEPLVAAISRDVKSDTYVVDSVDSLGRKTRGASTEKVKFSPLKTAYNKDMTGMLAWLGKTKPVFFNPTLSREKMPLWLHNRLVEVTGKGVKGADGVRGQTAYDSGTIPSTLRQQSEALPQSAGLIVDQPAPPVKKASTLTLRKNLSDSDPLKILQSRVTQIEAVLAPLPESYRGATLIDILYGNDPHPKFTSKEGKINLRIGMYLEERSLAALGGKELSTSDPKDQDTIASLAAAEALAAMDANGNAKEWYDATIRKTIELASTIHPKITTDPRYRAAFALATAISSQNLNVEDNMRFAVQVMDAWVANGADKFPLIGTGKSSGAIKNNFAKANKLIDSLGWDGFTTLLSSQHANSFLIKVFGSGSSGDSMGLVISGSSVFGPKIGGGFFQNLMGNFDPVTMDMWFSRTIGRLTGRIRAFDSELLAKQLESMREAFDNEGDASRSIQAINFADTIDYELFMTDDEYALGAAEEIRLTHEKDFKNRREQFDQKLRFKSALVARAEALSATVGKLRDSPDSATHRNELRQITFMATKKIKEVSGEVIPPASFQALIWYPEQHLYRALGGKQRVVGQDYVGAMQKVLDSRGMGASLVSSPGASYAPAYNQESKAPATALEFSSEDAGQSVVFEVAPDPSNEVLSAQWQALPMSKRSSISKKLGIRYAKKVLAKLGMQGVVESRVGSYLDKTNPSIIIKLGKGGDPMLAAGLLGYTLSQKEMVVTSDKSFTGSAPRGVVTVDLPAGLSLAEIDAVYQDLRKIKNSAGKSVVGGQTTTGDQMAILNFSEYDSQQLTNAEMAGMIDQHLGGKYTVNHENIFSAMPGKEEYDYGSSGQNGATPTRRASLQGDANSLRAAASADLAKELGTAPRLSRDLPGNAPALGFAEPAGRSDTRSGESKRPGIGIQGAIHYGRQEGLSFLSGSSFGTGIRGAEQKRLGEPGTDPRIKQRVYFYLPVQGGIPAPEQGLSGNVYSADLTGLYDPDGSIKGSGNALETAILDAGYRGYINREQGTAVVLGESVPVNFLGSAHNFTKVQRSIQRIVAATTSRTEGDETVKKFNSALTPTMMASVKSAAPSFYLQYGEARVKTAELDAASSALEGVGSDFRFSRTSLPVTIQIGDAKLQIKDAGDAAAILNSKLAKYRQLLSCLR